ncbi:MAG TPA: IclR family transcriptional regulator [Rhizomicrobium sp.]|nr:IclR family transcriptional regulator [Rhizomicrobium sp.]
MATPKNQSVLKAFTMLKAFHRPDEWLTSCELSRRANLPEASGYRLIQTLEQIGAVVRGPRGRYRPGMLLVSLSHNVAIGDLLREASIEVITALANRFDLTVHLGLLEGSMVTYIAKVCTPTSLALHTRLGSQLEAYCSGLGKVLLAALPDDQMESVIMDGELVALTPHTITDRTRLRAELMKVRRTGYAMDDREIRADMRCLAVPIHDSEGRTVAAMSATDHADRMTPDRQAQILEAMLDAAHAVEHKIYPPAPQLKPALPQRRPHAAVAAAHT